MDSITPLYSILRIKRKLTSSQSPLDALLIDAHSPSSNKRRRQIGPAAANSSLPSTPTAPVSNSNGPRGIFHFAATVPVSSFNSATQTRQLKDRISACLQRPTTPRSSSAPSSAPSSPSTRKPPSSAASLRRPGSAAGGAESPQLRKQQRVQGFHEENKRARYRIIERQRSTAQGLGSGWSAAEQGAKKVDLSEGARGGARPPVVMSSADLGAQAAAAAQADQTRIYDAVEEESFAPRHAHLLSSSENDDKDAEMTSQFATMLEEYLTLQDNAAGSASSAAPSPPPSAATPLALASPAPEPALAPAPEEDEGEYVYDVYYRDLREPAIAALAGGALGSAGAGGMDVAGLEGLKRVGELAGLEDDEILADGGEESDEEVDEDDQDSNEENDYRNDYPDGEDQESDFSGDGEGGERQRGWGGESDDSGEEW